MEERERHSEPSPEAAEIARTIEDLRAQIEHLADALPDVEPEAGPQPEAEPPREESPPRAPQPPEEPPQPEAEADADLQTGQATRIAQSISSIIGHLEREAAEISERAAQEATQVRADAESEATGILEDATSRADRLVVERIERIENLKDSLLDRARSLARAVPSSEEIEAGFAALADALDDTGNRLEGLIQGTSRPDGGAPSEATASEHGSATAEPDPDDETRRKGAAAADEPEDAAPAPRHREALKALSDALGRRSPRQPRSDSSRSRPEAEHEANDARTVVLQMAVAGRSRTEVEQHLRSALGIEDPGDLLDEVFGEG